MMRRRKRKEKILVERERERERERDVARAKRRENFFSLLSLKQRHAQKSTHHRVTTQFFLLRFNNTPPSHFLFQSAREREIKRRRNNVRRSRFCSFFSRRSARGVSIINNISIFIQRTTNSAGNVFFCNPKINTRNKHGASSERKHDKPERPDRGIRGQRPHRGKSRRTR